MKYFAIKPSKHFMSVIAAIGTLLLILVADSLLIHRSRHYRLFWFRQSRDNVRSIIGGVMRDASTKDDIAEVNELLIKRKNTSLAVKSWAPFFATGMLRAGDERYLPFLTHIVLDKGYSLDCRVQGLQAMNDVRTSSLAEILNELSKREDDFLGYHAERMLEALVGRSGNQTHSLKIEINEDEHTREVKGNTASRDSAPAPSMVQEELGSALDGVLPQASTGHSK